jgi:LAO/AO transport system kinase
MHAPGLGDEIQAIKAGIMEIADIFVVNKADRENANKTAIDIEAMLQLSNEKSGWKPPVLKTVALTGEGVPELIEKLEEHKCSLEGEIERKKALLRCKAEAELLEAIKQSVSRELVNELKRQGRFDDILREIIEKKKDPASAAEELVKKAFRNV